MNVKCLCLLFVLGVCCSATQASTYFFDLDYEYSGNTPPSQQAPWLRVLLDDGGTAGSVLLTFMDLNLATGEFVSKLYLNLDPTLDAEQLLFSAPAKVGAFSDPTISLGEDDFKADGDGYFDVLLGFATSGGAAGEFTSGDSLTYSITGIPTLTADSFIFYSEPGGGNGVWPVASHVQGIGGTSGWVTAISVGVPEPATMMLLGMGGLAAVFRKRRAG